MKTCLYKPIFINPLAYYVFPQLYNIEPKNTDLIEYALYSGQLIVTDITNDSTYSTYNRSNSIDLSKYNKKCIRISLYTDTGAVVLGEWNLDIGNESGDTDVKPIASYRCYDKTNDDTDRAILKDLTGNGHDIQLYNFGFAESSGYGKYATDFIKFKLYNRGDTPGAEDYRCEISASSSTIHVTHVYIASLSVCEYVNSIKFQSYKIRVTGLNGRTLKYRAEMHTLNVPYFDITEDGIYTLPAATIETQYQSAFFVTTAGECDITIEQIPDYQGALVSDGVDDYGLCENFPIFTPEKGFTICCIREKLISNNDTRHDCIYYIGNNDLNLPIISKLAYTDYNELIKKAVISSFNKQTSIDEDKSGFNYQTSLKYNGYNLNKGTESGGGRFTLFCQGLESGKYLDYSNTAIYALEIYDRDLTDEEIATVKARMIAEYEEKTGNKYEEETV